MRITAPVLILNASFEAISVREAKRALVLVLKGAATVLEEYDSFVWRDMRMPSVIRLNKFRNVPRPRHEVTRRGVFQRDQYSCQYCGVKFSPASNKLTMDHVIPVSRGGRKAWENLVTSCCSCNHRKADRTPEEAGMRLLSTPRAVSIHTNRWLMRNMGEREMSWKKYLFY
jgi:5-methylcytosine-specific restriction endonuclease McrA